MTSTKRKRLYIEDERPLPGDIVELLAVGSPVLRHMGDYNDRVKWLREPEKALVIAVCDVRFLEWMMVMMLKDNVFGWIENKRMQVLISGREGTQ